MWGKIIELVCFNTSNNVKKIIVFINDVKLYS